MQARGPMAPKPPDGEEIETKLYLGEFDSDQVRSCISYHAQKENWFSIFLISQRVSREVSILIDADNRIWVDWGTKGEVHLHPPAGSRLPYKLWVHTHPRGKAYWSDTDKNSLAIASTILEKALVLGIDGVLSTSIIDDEQIPTLSGKGPISQWSAEKVKSWFAVEVSSKGVNE